MPACDDGASSVGIFASENELSCASLGEGTTDAATGSAILDRTREIRVLIVTANRQLPTTKENMAATFHRTDSHPGSRVPADVQDAVPENRHPRGAAAGTINKTTQTRHASDANAIPYH